MSASSPLIFQKNTLIEKHQLEGNDPPGRYFSRMAMITRTATGYTARVQYESVTAETPSLPTVAEALRDCNRHNRGCARQGGYGSAIVVQRDPDAEGRLVDLDGKTIWPPHGRGAGAAEWVD